MTCPVSVHWADPDLPEVPCALPKGHDGQHWYGDAPTPAVDLDPCRECHPELHRAQCWPNARCVAAEEDA